jgi:hypothetical protein
LSGWQVRGRAVAAEPGTDLIAPVREVVNLLIRPKSLTNFCRDVNLTIPVTEP